MLEMETGQMGVLAQTTDDHAAMGCVRKHYKLQHTPTRDISTLLEKG